MKISNIKILPTPSGSNEVVGSTEGYEMKYVVYIIDLNFKI
jgi:hypothetical protein